MKLFKKYTPEYKERKKELKKELLVNYRNKTYTLKEFYDKTFNLMLTLLGLMFVIAVSDALDPNSIFKFVIAGGMLILTIIGFSYVIAYGPVEKKMLEILKEEKIPKYL